MWKDKVTLLLLLSGLLIKSTMDEVLKQSPLNYRCRNKKKINKQNEDCADCDWPVRDQLPCTTKT